MSTTGPLPSPPAAAGCGKLDWACDGAKKAGGAALDFAQDPVGTTRDLAGDAAGGASGNIATAVLDGIASGVADAMGTAVKSMATLWVKTPTGIDGSGRETIAFLQGSVFWYVGAIAVFSVLFAGGRMAWEGRGQPAKDLLQSLMTLVLVSAMAVPLVILAASASDLFAEWILDRAGTGDSDFNSFINSVVGNFPGGPIMAIGMGSFILLASLIQSILLIARTAVVIILAGILPLAGAATNTNWGKQWLSKIMGWLVGWILYKPAAAFVYAAAIELGGHSKGLTGTLVVLSMFVMAIVALPAMIRLVVPMVGGLSSTGAGGAMAAAGGAAMLLSGGPTGAVATAGGSGGGGAVRVSGGGSGGSSGGHGQSGASGSDGATGNSGSPGASSTPRTPPSGGPTGGQTGGGTGGTGGGQQAAGTGAAAGPAGAVAGSGMQSARAVKSAINSNVGEEGGPSGHSGHS